MKPDYKLTRHDYDIAVKSGVFSKEELELIDVWLEDKLTITPAIGEVVGMSINKASQLLNHSDEWLRRKVKSGEVVAFQCAVGYAVPIHEIIKLKKAGR